jgi:signal transduction histidine kinase/CheY-like chemotaxis protein/HPt (histidine-containing phosphotransfer) domain-containing protein
MSSRTGHLPYPPRDGAIVALQEFAVAHSRVIPLTRRRWRDYSIRAKGLLVLAAPLLAMLAASALFFVANAKNEDARQWVQHSFEVKEQAQRLLAQIISTETGMRGFLLTGERPFLQTYEEARDELPLAFERLQELTADNPAQQHRLRHSIHPLLEQRLALLTEAILKFSAGKHDNDLVETLHAGRESMARVRAAMDEFIAAENELLVKRQTRAEQIAARTSWALVGTTLFGLFVGLCAMLLFTRSIAKRLDHIVAQTEKLPREEISDEPLPGEDEIGRLGRACYSASKLLAQRREDLMRAKAAAEMSNRAKSEFLANISHEIRTPLNGIMGLTDIVLTTSLTSTQRDHLDMVKHSAETLLMLMNQLLDFSKIEAGKLALEKRPFDLHDLVEKKMRILRTRTAAKGLELHANVSPRVPQCVSADALRLRQVLINLLDNAIKFTEHGSITLDVDAPVIEADACELEFAVSDTGIGIPLEKQQLIFEAFAQADTSTTRNYGGTGLGLTICSELVRLMGGHLSVQSTSGSGSTFRFRIKAEVVNRAAFRTPAPVETIDAPSVALRVLVAEDNPVNQAVARGLLDQLGHQVTSASNGREALRLAQQNRFDAILMDVQMPEMDGVTATSRIREWEHEHNRRTAIIAMTAHAAADDRARCLRAGMDDYLPKPISRDTLAAALQRLGSGERPAANIAVARLSTRSSRDQLLAKLGGDESLCNRVADLFASSAPPLLEQLEKAFSCGDFSVARMAAHSLRGSLANIGADEGSAAATKLEQLARNELAEGSAEPLHELRYQVDRVLTGLGRTADEFAHC